MTSAQEVLAGTVVIGFRRSVRIVAALKGSFSDVDVLR